jgi:hypothetical protein
MDEHIPIACSLEATDLRLRLDLIAEVGAGSLLAHDVEDGRHALRFRGDVTTRDRLEKIVAAEAECCPFLDLVLAEHGGELVLTIAAPEEGASAADALAAAFTASSG